MRRTAIALGLVAAGMLSSCSLGAIRGDATVIAYFSDVGDLVEDATVQINDIEIGTVKDIELVLEDGVMLARVTMSVDSSKPIPADDLAALVRQTSLLGEQFVELVPQATGAPFLSTGTTTIPVERTDRRVDIETFLSDLSAFVGGGGLEDLNRFTHAQALILEDRGRRFGVTISELERFTRTLADRRLDIAGAIDHLASASRTLATNRDTLDSFLDSLEDANALLADQGDELTQLFASLRRFGEVNARFLSRHEEAIGRQFQALRPILEGLASAQGDLRVDIAQLRTFFELFPKALGGGPGGDGEGDYVQVQAIICETLSACHTKGEKGDVPGEGS
jgi:phospholipid/cholesterol/gamma-HCH transport system substrate-binding protein